MDAKSSVSINLTLASDGCGNKTIAGLSDFDTSGDISTGASSSSTCGNDSFGDSTSGGTGDSSTGANAGNSAGDLIGVGVGDTIVKLVEICSSIIFCRTLSAVDIYVSSSKANLLLTIAFSCLAGE